MTDKHIDGSHIRRVPAVAETLVGLPRSTKRAIMLAADAVAIPVALWAALVLKFDAFAPPPAHEVAPFLVAVSSALLIFSALGLYRAVIRFMGAKAMMSVVAGVTLSVLALGAYDRFHAGSPLLPESALAIYWALALLYVIGSRFFIRLPSVIVKMCSFATSAPCVTISDVSLEIFAFSFSSHFASSSGVLALSRQNFSTSNGSSRQRFSTKARSRNASKLPAFGPASRSRNMR